MQTLKTSKKLVNTSPVAVVGWSGYSGIELCKLILAHPHMELAACFSRSPEQKLTEFLPSAPDVAVLNIENLASEAEKFDTIFFATPIEVSQELIPKIKNKNVTVIDLSGAFRLGHDDFTYGLQPWQKETSKRVANPGCYATSVQMALLPLLKNKLIDADTIVIDAKSGTTGAGKSAKTELLSSEVADNCLPYKVGTHQHLPEMIAYLQKFSSVKTQPFFTPHLMPFKRGIISAIYAKTYATENEIAAAYNEAYETYPLVKFQSLDTAPNLLKLNQVVGSARTHISYRVVGEQLFLFSCIDNLMKGAASQALENWNALHELPVTTALEDLL